MALKIYPNGQLRDGRVTSLAFTYRNLKTDIGTVPISTLTNYIGGKYGLLELDKSHISLSTAVSFSIEAIEIVTFANYGEQLLSANVTLAVGEKRRIWESPLLGELQSPSYNPYWFKHFEFKHRPDGSCDCIELNPLQSFELAIENMTQIMCSVQVCLIGTMFVPVP